MTGGQYAKRTGRSFSFQQVGAAPSESVELFDFLEDAPMWIKDRDGFYQWVNVAFLQNFGLAARDEIIGRTDFEVCGYSFAVEYRLDDEQVLKGEKIKDRVELVGRFDHTATWRRTSKVPLRDKTGRIVGTAGITRELPAASGELACLEKLGVVTEFLGRNLGRRITNREMARLYGSSVRVFERHFRQAYRLAPHDYLCRLRVRQSARLLVFSTQPIAAIGQEFGFFDQSHYTKAFKRIMKCTPRAYRLRYRRDS